MPIPAGLGGLIGGLGSFAGGLAGLLGGGGNNNAALNASRINADQDREFQRAAMQYGIRWRVDDAKAAGIHPLFALGAPTFNPSPTSLMSDGGHQDLTPQYLRDMGQGVERAIHSTLTPQERTVTQTLQAQSVERGQLQNELLRTQIASQRARLSQEQVGPAGPSAVPVGVIGGQADMGPHRIQPAEIEGSNRLGTAAAGPARNDTVFTATPTGLSPSPNPKLINDTDVLNPEYLLWGWRNRVFPNPQRGPTLDQMQARFPGAKGSYWDKWNFEWRPVF